MDGAESGSQEEQLKASLDALGELNKYGFSLLEEVTRRGHQISGREAYLAALFISALAQTKAIIHLLDSRQLRVSESVTRTLYEIWVNIRFIYCDRTFLYARFQIMIGERKRVKMSRILHGDGDLKEEDLKRHESNLHAIESWLDANYPTWPEEIPDVINPKKKRPVERRDGFDLKQRCAIIDHYNQKYHRTNPKYKSMIEHYERFYPYFSGGPHADPIELNSAFNERKDAIHIDVDGSGNSDAIRRLSEIAFTFQYEIAGTVKYKILKERPPKMPAWIDMHARDLGLID